jgi:hypothetical protein
MSSQRFCYVPLRADVKAGLRANGHTEHPLPTVSDPSRGRPRRPASRGGCRARFRRPGFECCRQARRLSDGSNTPQASSAERCSKHPPHTGAIHRRLTTSTSQGTKQSFGTRSNAIPVTSSRPLRHRRERSLHVSFEHIRPVVANAHCSRSEPQLPARSTSEVHPLAHTCEAPVPVPRPRRHPPPPPRGAPPRRPPHGLSRKPPPHRPSPPPLVKLDFMFQRQDPGAALQQFC